MARIHFPILLLMLPHFASADDWPQWLGPKRDGVLRETDLVQTFPEKGLKRLWANLIGPGYSGPAVADGRLFVMDRELAKDAKNPASGFQKPEVLGQERILCYDANTGKELWTHSYDCTYKVQYGSGPRCTPTVDGELVYCLGTMGDLRCLEVATGKLVWSKNFVKDFNARVPIWGFASHPLVDGDKLVCLTGGDESQLVIAFDKKTGKELWKSQSLMADCGYCPPMIYTFAGVRTLVIWHSRACVGLNPETGKRLWSQPFDVKAALTTPTPRQLGDKLFITAFYEGPMMLDLSKPGEVKIDWKGNGKGETPEKTDKLHSIMATPFIKDGYIYGVCSYGELRCLKADTGERVWETRKATVGTATEEGAPTRWGNAFLIENEDRFFIFNERGWLINAKLTPKGYEEISRTYIIVPSNKMAGRPVVWSHPAFANKKMYVRNDAELVCVDLAK